MNNTHGDCVECGADTDNRLGEFCMICDDLKDVCWDCMGLHLIESHTQAEYMQAQNELLA